MGWVQLGYLNFYFMAMEYPIIPGAVAFIRPTDPGTSTPLPHGEIVMRAGGTIVPLTAADIATQQVAHDRRKREYNEV